MNYQSALTRLTRPIKRYLIGIVLSTQYLLPSVHANTDFITFESGPVRPIALSKDGKHLFATNTPDNRLEIFAVTESGLISQGSVLVGLEPVAIAVRNEKEVWVVNHLSDSVSIVDVSLTPPRIVRTLLVGDEPRDIVFSANDRAFITTARRGQHRTHQSIATVPGAGDPKLSTPSIPRADVWVFDANNLSDELGGRPLKIVELFGDTPRALATSPDKSIVYAAIFNSGNLTTSISEGTVCEHGQAPCTIKGQVVPGDIMGPKTDKHGDRAPLVGIIVKQDPETKQFFDPRGKDWTQVVKFTLPDNDVFAIDAGSLESVNAFKHVGTTLFNMVTNPKTGTLYVANTEANNFGVFEGPGDFGGSTVQGHLAETRITVINNNGVQARHLNKHIDYNLRPAPASVKQHSLSTPLEMVVSQDGKMLAVAAYGSAKIGIFNTDELESNTFDPTVASSGYIDIPGGGPAGLVLDETRDRLYVLTRFDNSVVTVDMSSKQAVQSVVMFNPEPQKVVEGRKFLYDATLTSSNGEAACASCHIFGDVDHLAWNLGNPDDEVIKNPLPILLEEANTAIGELLGFKVEHVNGTGEMKDLHPMKGPMTTQTFKGMVNNGAMHWRGDRSVGFFGTDQNQEPPFDSKLSFKNFIVAFPGLNGTEDIIAEDDMQKFADFALALTLGPNPIRALDNSLTRAQQRGRKFYMGCEGPGVILCGLNGRPIIGEHRVDGVPFLPRRGATCEGCHTLDPKKGFFGTDGKMSFDFVEQVFKVPQIRNVYTKVGMFGNPPANRVNDKDHGFKGEQVRGYGVFHDGGLDTVTRFMNGTIFNPRFADLVGFVGGEPQRRDIEEFVMAFDNDLAPITGQQITLTQSSSPAVNTRIDLLIQRARANFDSQILGGKVKECELVVSGVINGKQMNWLYNARKRRFFADKSEEKGLRDGQLRELAQEAGHALTYTCVPFGSGTRIALDRNRDGLLNRDKAQVSETVGGR